MCGGLQKSLEESSEGIWESLDELEKFSEDLWKSLWKNHEKSLQIGGSLEVCRNRPTHDCTGILSTIHSFRVFKETLEEPEEESSEKHSEELHRRLWKSSEETSEEFFFGTVFRRFLEQVPGLRRLLGTNLLKTDDSQKWMTCVPLVPEWIISQSVKSINGETMRRIDTTLNNCGSWLSINVHVISKFTTESAYCLLVCSCREEIHSRVRRSQVYLIASHRTALSGTSEAVSYWPSHCWSAVEAEKFAVAWMSCIQDRWGKQVRSPQMTAYQVFLQERHWKQTLNTKKSS